MEHGPLQDVFPIENGDIPAAMLVCQREDGRPKPFSIQWMFFLIFVKGKLGKSDFETNNVSLDRWWCNVYIIYVNSIYTFLKIMNTYLRIYSYIYKAGFGSQFWHTAYGLMDSSWISGWLWWWVFGFGEIWWQLNSTKQLVGPGFWIDFGRFSLNPIWKTAGWKNTNYLDGHPKSIALRSHLEK